MKYYFYYKDIKYANLKDAAIAANVSDILFRKRCSMIKFDDYKIFNIKENKFIEKKEKLKNKEEILIYANEVDKRKLNDFFNQIGRQSLNKQHRDILLEQIKKNKI